jgi:hypothetical protein
LTLSVTSQGADFSQGVLKISDNMNEGTPVQIEVNTGDTRSQYPYRDAFMWGGDMRSEEEVVLPRNVITSMNIRIGNKKCIVPFSAYSDLGNPRQISFENTSLGFQLIIIGGDAGSSYKAVLVFNREDIERRKVAHGEFPDEVWEETLYSFIPANDKR